MTTKFKEAFDAYMDDYIRSKYTVITEPITIDDNGGFITYIGSSKCCLTLRVDGYKNGIGEIYYVIKTSVGDLEVDANTLSHPTCLDDIPFVDKAMLELTSNTCIFFDHEASSFISYMDNVLRYMEKSILTVNKWYKSRGYANTYLPRITIYGTIHDLESITSQYDQLFSRNNDIRVRYIRNTPIRDPNKSPWTMTCKSYRFIKEQLDIKDDEITILVTRDLDVDIHLLYAGNMKHIARIKDTFDLNESVFVHKFIDQMDRLLRGDLYELFNTLIYDQKRDNLLSTLKGIDENFSEYLDCSMVRNDFFEVGTWFDAITWSAKYQVLWLGFKMGLIGDKSYLGSNVNLDVIVSKLNTINRAISTYYGVIDPNSPLDVMKNIYYDAIAFRIVTTSNYRNTIESMVPFIIVDDLDRWFTDEGKIEVIPQN